MASQPPAGGNTGGKRRRPRPGFSNVYSMNDQPPPPPPRNDPPPSPPQPPGSNQATQPSGTSNLGGPSQTGGGIQHGIEVAPPPFSGQSLLQSTGIFDLTGIRQSEIDKVLEGDTNMPDTPSKTNKEAITQLQGMVNSVRNDEDLLALFQNRINNASQGQTVEERKTALRNSVQPWITTGLSYKGPRRPALFLPDGTRNPERPPRGAGGGPGTATTGTQGPPPPGTGNPPSGPKNTSTGNQAPPPAGRGDKSSTGTGKGSATGTRPQNTGAGTKSSTGTGTSSSTGTRPQNTGAGTNSSTGTRPRPHTGTRPTGPGNSPLSRPPLSVDDIQDPGPGTSAANTSGTGGPGQGNVWHRRDDLFAPHVMDAAGIRWFSAGEAFNALPTLESTIDYNTENWG